MRSALCCHSNETCAPIANQHYSAQLEDTTYNSSTLHPSPCNSVGMRRGAGSQIHRCAWPIYISRRLREVQ